MEWMANLADGSSMHLHLVLLFLSAIAADPVHADPVQARVVRIVDGDTLRVVVDEGGDEVRVRIWGVDTPERGQALATEATAELAHLAAPGQTVTLDVQGRDRYGRTVARVINAAGEDAGEVLVCAGLARWVPRYARRAVNLASCQATAQASGVGVWAVPVEAASDSPSTSAVGQSLGPPAWRVAQRYVGPRRFPMRDR